MLPAMRTAGGSARTRHWRERVARYLGVAPDEKAAIYVAVVSSATLTDPVFWAEILFSAGIATLGLILGSPAVIIGAMLISPLMGPILSAGLALAAGDVVLAVRAAVGIGLSSAVAIAFSTLLVVLLPFREMTAEIAARTHPNTLDLVIALFSGAVGALAVSKTLRGVATSIPGVAIAVALMPPLCVTGYGIGVLLTLDRLQGLATMRGGALLFFTNLAAITFSSMVVFLLLDVDAPEVRRLVRARRQDEPRTSRTQAAVDRLLPGERTLVGGLPARLLLAFSLLVLVWVPLRRSFNALAAEIHQRQVLNSTRKAASALWTDLLGRTASGRPRSYIDALDAEVHDRRLDLSIRAFVSERVTVAERGLYLRRLARELDRQPDSIDLDLVEIPTSSYQLAQRPEEAVPAPPPPPTLGARFQGISREALGRLAEVPLPSHAAPLDWSLTVDARGPTATLAFLGPADLGVDAQEMIAFELRQRLELPQLDLRCEWIPTRSELHFARHEVVPGVEARQAVAVLAARVAPRPALHLRLLAADDELGHQRAAAVASALVAAGVEAERVATGVQGEGCPRCVLVLVEPAVGHDDGGPS